MKTLVFSAPCSRLPWARWRWKAARAANPKHTLDAVFSDPKTVATQLREYVNNPHHIDPMSQAFKRLIEGAAKLLLAQSADGKEAEFMNTELKCFSVGECDYVAAENAEQRLAIARGKKS